ncbi:hypothetical protein EDC14_100649 [Hydrogenispora ethanolica]|uniref:Uncharacterized protein n=1 Tax=Hydrogenispora ethanolica TaxID=1082276 RepID=A0A4R1S0A3_HYDET|nr:hypothetical protein [Hydrogenispora ethanolica]TCL72339.1 hypothetical protein EDC14_100649 [Hydrogenispora ethanolica]
MSKNNTNDNIEWKIAIGESMHEKDTKDLEDILQQLADQDDESDE